MNDLYGQVFREMLYPVWESGLRQRPTLRHLRRLERTQWCSLDELKSLQEAELGKLLAHAWSHVPHYQASFRRAGVEPGDIRALDDLSKLPLLTRQDAADLDARKSFAPPLPQIDKATSGTTGAPLVFGYDVGSEYWRQAIKLRGYAWAGYRPGDRSLHFWGSPTVRPPPLAKRVKASLDHFVRREHYVDCTERSEEQLGRVVQALRKHRPMALVCYAQAGAALARYINENGSRDWADISVIAAAERLFPKDRDELVQAFGPRIFETYGNREVMLIAAECEAHEGMHLSMENLIVELVVRREGEPPRPALEGELGEVVVTDLHNYGAPFIRYVTGDQAVQCSAQRCACGRSLPRLARVEGRTTDTLRDGEGRAVSGLFFNVLFAALAHQVREFQVVQRKDGAIDLKLVPTRLFEDGLLEQLRSHCDRHIPGVELRTQLVSQLKPDRGGKLRVVAVES